jgi:hypothetical protein
MLSTAENELICRVGPGTPMGNLMRQYWIPALLSSEVYRVRSGEILPPKGANWVDATQEYRKAFVEHPELDWSMAEAG